MKNKSFKKLVSSLLIAVMLFSSFGVVFGATASTDIKGHWAEGQISAWIDKGLIKGYEDGSFKPDNSITRAEFIALINRSFGFTEAAAISFSDVAASNWAYAEVAKAVKAEYITGYEDGTIGASKPISRQEVAVIVDRLLELSKTESASTSFTDSSTIALWAKGSVDAAVAKGILKGYAEDNSFKPSKSITRAEAVVTLDRAVAAKATVYNTAGTYGPATGTETINGNVIIAVAGVTLQNVIITGNLTLAAGIGEGDAFLNNVTVKGTTNINGGGENSIHFKDSTILTIVINKPTGTVRIVAEGTTSIKAVNVQTPTTLESTNTDGSGFSNVTLDKDLPKDSKVTLKGSFENVEVLGDGAKVDLPEGTNITKFKTDTDTTVTGKGTITTAELGAGSTTTFETKPTTTTVGTATPVPTAAPTTAPTPTPVPTDSGSGNIDIHQASVSNIDQLKTALNNSTITTINITADITDVAEGLLVNRALTINGGNHNISYTNAINSLAYGSRFGIAVMANGVTINNLRITMTALANWQGAYALQVYNATGVTLNNFTGTGADAALCVNASEVTLTGTTTVSGNEFGGIEVAKGTDVGGVTLSTSKLTVAGTLVNTSESSGKPTIWLINGQGTIADGPATTSTTIVPGQTQYYISAASVVTTDVANLAQLKTALNNSTITTINITADITNVAEGLLVNRALTINGGNHNISYTNAINSLAYGSRFGIAVMASGVTINNLSITMTSLANWQGVYALQVYNATDVTLNNFTGTGADAALCVNASEVTLTGTTTVSGNEFGGIEVAKGTDVDVTLNNSKLTVAGTVVNASESYGKPTIWLVTLEGAVDVTGSIKAFTTSNTIVSEQTQYYLIANTVSNPDIVNLGQLKTALADIAISSINITANISGIKEPLVVNRVLTIEGNNHNISYTNDINLLLKGSRHGIAVMASGVTINNLSITMAESLGWQGAYALQVYNAKEVTLNNFTGTGADAALCVNASEVTLIGTTTVSGNEYGGIEVSKGTDVGGITLSVSKLTVTGTLVNGSEEERLPTIWLVNGEGDVNVTGITVTSSSAIVIGQTQYYLNSEYIVTL